MSENERRQIVNLWESGATIEQMIRLLPYRRKDSQQMINELRADGTLAPRHKKERARQILANAVNEGMTDLRELSETYGFTASTIKAYLTNTGAKRGRPAHNTKKRELSQQTQQIMRDLQSGKTIPALAKRYGLSRQRIHTIKKQMEEGR